MNASSHQVRRMSTTHATWHSDSSGTGVMYLVIMVSKVRLAADQQNIVRESPGKRVRQKTGIVLRSKEHSSMPAVLDTQIHEPALIGDSQQIDLEKRGEMRWIVAVLEHRKTASHEQREQAEKAQ